MVKTNQKQCININFSEGLGIFDTHYRYPEIDNQEINNGPTGKVKDIQGIQAHAGHDFFVPEGKELSLDIDECPYLHIAIKAGKDTKTCLLLMVHDKKPDDHKNRFVVIGKTPEGDPGIYDVIKGCFTIKDDDQWHEPQHMKGAKQHVYADRMKQMDRHWMMESVEIDSESYKY